MIAHNQMFRDINVYLDGSTFIGCTFERCTFIFSGLILSHLEANAFLGCKWQMAGPAANTLGFLTAIYSQGGEAKDLVEKTFDNIRKNATGQRHAGDTIVLN